MSLSVATVLLVLLHWLLPNYVDCRGLRLLELVALLLALGLGVIVAVGLLLLLIQRFVLE